MGGGGREKSDASVWKAGGTGRSGGGCLGGGGGGRRGGEGGGGTLAGVASSARLSQQKCPSSQPEASTMTDGCEQKEATMEGKHVPGHSGREYSGSEAGGGGGGGVVVVVVVVVVGSRRWGRPSGGVGLGRRLLVTQHLPPRGHSPDRSISSHKKAKKEATHVPRHRRSSGIVLGASVVAGPSGMRVNTVVGCGEVVVGRCVVVVVVVVVVGSACGDGDCCSDCFGGERHVE